MKEMKEGDLELLQQIELFEQSHDIEKDFTTGWTWHDVQIWPASLNRLFINGYLELVYRSNSQTGYRLSELGKVMSSGDYSEEEPENDPLKIPDDLFEVIEGYDDIKALIRRVLNSEKPVHVLFTGVPSSAKTMFLLELARCGAPYVLGSQSSKAGIADLLFDVQPELLVIDEIDRFTRKDLAVLLSLTQTGIIAETKMGKRRETKLSTKVFAASNTLKMAPELLSRFMLLHFKRYSNDDFMQVVKNLLQKREGVDEELAAYIAEKVWERSPQSPDPREAIRLARLGKTREDIDWVLGTQWRYRSA